MDWNYFKPTRWKIIVSFILTVIWMFIIMQTVAVPLMACLCASGGFDNCTDFHSFLIIKNPDCHCGCTSLIQVFMQYLTMIIIPFIIVYVIYSLIEMIIPKKS